MSTIYAARPEYNRRTRTYDVAFLKDVHSLGTAAGEGYLVYDDAEAAYRGVLDGRLVSSWNPAKRHAVAAFLKGHARGQTGDVHSTALCGWEHLRDVYNIVTGEVIAEAVPAAQAQSLSQTLTRLFSA